MILLGIRCPKEATTPKSHFSESSPFHVSLGRGQMVMGIECCAAYLATIQGCGLGDGTTTDNSFTAIPSCLKVNK